MSAFVSLAKSLTLLISSFFDIICLLSTRTEVGDIVQEVIFFFDDSGVLHKNEPSGYFVYAGYVFTDELKAANLEVRHKRALFNSVREYDSVDVVVDISRVYNHILADKKSICRYKDYVLKRCVKNKLNHLIADGIISKDEEIKISIYIDEQLTATNGYYDLRDSIMEELQYGIANFDYGIRHPHLFDANVSVNIQYCDSSSNYMIQASDILANRIWTSYRTKNRNLRQIDSHLTLTFP